MKKSYLMIAAAAGLMLTACTSEDDYAAQNAAVEQGDGAVLFDTYLSNNTRAGQEGVMTTTTLQSTGFGIVAYQHALATGDYTPSTTPNFMWNQYVGYEASNWVYSPLKYWPNETTTDKATSSAVESNATAHNEGVSFYAYAPFVASTAGTAVGITALTSNNTSGDPKVTYKVAYGYGYTGTSETDKSTLPSRSVDLLWGVSSGFAYHPVNLKDRDGVDLGAGVQTVIMPEGLPVEKMQKPSLDEKIKFNFNHALARIGLTVVGAFDQKAQGGILDDRTRVTISEITVTSPTDGAFATEGVLNLDNTTANRALWEIPTTRDANIDTDGNSAVDAVGVRVTDAVADEMNPELRADQDHYSAKFPDVAGVKATEQYVLTENSYTQVPKPVFDEKKTYFADDNGTLIELTKDNIVWSNGDDADFKWYTYDKDNKKYTYKADPEDWDLYKETSYINAKFTSAIAASIEVSSLSAEQKSKIYYTLSGSDYTESALPETGSTSQAYYTVETKAPVAKYKNDVFELTTKPRYFMIIPTTGATPTDKVVTVTIKYYVTTRDAKLTNRISKTENFIKQNVTLKEFTNGKAYNLKLILGLTSVKVDAEVSNWEIGTVESNLPQNLE